jgi:hypothetical protein
MSKAKMEAARELIKDKHYKEARAILQTVDHPTAKEWIAKIDAIAPPKRSGAGQLVALVALIVVLCAALGLIVYTQRYNIPQLAAMLASATPTATLAPTLTVTPTLTTTPVPTETFTPTNTPRATETNIPCELTREEQNIITEFLDSAETASTTSRINLSPIISDMQKTRRTFSNLDHSLCLQKATEKIDDGMGNVIQGFQEFEGQSEFISGYHLDQASVDFYDAFLLALHKGALIKDDRIFDTNVFLFNRDSVITPEPSPTTSRKPTSTMPVSDITPTAPLDVPPDLTADQLTNALTLCAQGNLYNSPRPWMDSVSGLIAANTWDVIGARTRDFMPQCGITLSFQFAWMTATGPLYHLSYAPNKTKAWIAFKTGWNP